MDAARITVVPAAFADIDDRRLEIAFGIIFGTTPYEFSTAKTEVIIGASMRAKHAHFKPSNFQKRARFENLRLLVHPKQIGPIKLSQHLTKV